MPEPETEPDVWRCETCVFFEPLDSEEGMCHRHAPRRSIKDGGMEFGDFTVVGALQFCGEWSDWPPTAVLAARERANGLAMGGAS